jgi:hypothetical protein
MPDLVRHRAGCILVLAVLLAASAQAAVQRRASSDFHQVAPVLGEVTAGTAYAVSLSQEAVAAAKQGGELRLFDAAGGEIPSLLHTAKARFEVVERPAKIFNRAWREDGTQTLELELTDRKPEGVNEFVFEIDANDYQLRTRVEGSQDGSEWSILGDGLHLIRHTVAQERIRYVHDVLRLPTTRFRHYRFTLTPELPPKPGESGTLEIRGVRVRESVRRGSSLGLPVRIERFEDPSDPDVRHHHWKLWLDSEDLGVDRVTLTIPGNEFARSASLWEWSETRGRRTRRLASTVLFRFGSDAQLEFSDFSTDASVLVLTIDQGDDVPIAPERARAARPRQQLRFLAPRDASLPLSLHFEPDEPREPRYDLERRLREAEIASFSELQHAPLRPNPGYAAPAPPRSERIPFLLYALVIPLVVGLGWYVARTIQRGVPDREDDPEA